MEGVVRDSDGQAAILQALQSLQQMTLEGNAATVEAMKSVQRTSEESSAAVVKTMQEMQRTLVDVRKELGVLQVQNRRQVKISEIDSRDFATFVDLVCAELVDMDIDLYLERWTNGDATVETIQAAYQQQSFQWTNLHEAQHMKPFMEALKQTIAVPTELSMAPVTGMPALLDFLTKVLPFDIRGTSDVAFFARPPGAGSKGPEELVQALVALIDICKEGRFATKRRSMPVQVVSGTEASNFSVFGLATDWRRALVCVYDDQSEALLRIRCSASEGFALLQLWLSEVAKEAAQMYAAQGETSLEVPVLRARRRFLESPLGKRVSAVRQHFSASAESGVEDAISRNLDSTFDEVSTASRTAALHNGEAAQLAEPDNRSTREQELLVLPGLSRERADEDERRLMDESVPEVVEQELPAEAMAREGGAERLQHQHSSDMGQRKSYAAVTKSEQKNRVTCKEEQNLVKQESPPSDSKKPPTRMTLRERPARVQHGDIGTAAAKSRRGDEGKATKVKHQASSLAVDVDLIAARAKSLYRRLELEDGIAEETQNDKAVNDAVSFLSRLPPCRWEALQEKENVSAL